MNNIRELPGFIKKSFILPYGGGEIWFEHLDGMSVYEALVIEKIRADKSQILRPSMTSLICVNVDETEVTDKIVNEIAEVFLYSGKKMRKICFVGTDLKSKRLIKKALIDREFLLNFINDFEKAKEWLVKGA